MDVLTFETCWAVNSEIIKQMTSSWSIFIQVFIGGFHLRAFLWHLSIVYKFHWVHKEIIVLLLSLERTRKPKVATRESGKYCPRFVCENKDLNSRCKVRRVSSNIRKLLCKDINVVTRLRRLFVKWVPSAHISRASSRTVTLRMCSDSYQFENPQTPFREIRVIFMFVPVRFNHVSLH